MEGEKQELTVTSFLTLFKNQISIVVACEHLLLGR